MPETTKDILIVEDDTDIRDSLSDFLQGEGYQIQTAENGQDALEVAHATFAAGKKIDLILLDLMMPVMDGVTFRKHQERDPVLSNIPVVVISADNRTRAIANEIGLYQCVLKPMSLDELLTAVEQNIHLNSETPSPTNHSPKARSDRHGTQPSF